MTMQPLHKHITNMNDRQNGGVYLLNLLSISKKKEGKLTDRFEACLQKLSKTYNQEHDKVYYDSFDQHDLCKNYNHKELIKFVLNTMNERFLNHSGWFMFKKVLKNEDKELSKLGFRKMLLEVLNPTLMKEDQDAAEWASTRCQLGAVRTNCLDSLDRTNAAQIEIGYFVFCKWLKEILNTSEDYQRQSVQDSLQTNVPPLIQSYYNLWSNCADYLSMLQTGSGSILSQQTRNKNITKFKSKIEGTMKSGQRQLQQQYYDETKQEAIDLILYKSNQVHTYEVLEESGDQTTKIQDNQGEIDENQLESVQKRRSNLIVENDQVVEVVNLENVVSKQSQLDPLGLVPREDQLQVSDFRVNIVTQNLGASKSDDCADLRDMVSTEDDQASDIIVFHFQEAVPLNTMNVAIKDNDDTQRDWREQLTLMLSDMYERDNIGQENIAEDQLVGLQSSIWVRRELILSVKQVAKDVVKLGFKNTLGNKGGVAMRLTLVCSNMCFINAHLESGTDQYPVRIENIRQLLRELFKEERKYYPVESKHEQVFIAGDLNFRVEKERNEVIQILGKPMGVNNIVSNNDQLMQAMTKEKDLFAKWSEPKIEFFPSYKQDRGTLEFDTSKKMRTPSQCDRCLFKTGEVTELEAKRLISTAEQNPDNIQFDDGDQEDV